MNETNRKFLWKRDPNPQQHPLKTYKVTSSPLPNIIDLRTLTLPIYDQGSLGSCTANALGFAMQYLKTAESKANSKNKIWPVPSRLFIYYNERVIEDAVDEDAGAIIADGVTVLKTRGSCAEADQKPLWPYDIDKFAVKPPDECYKVAFENRITKASRVAQSLLQLKTALNEGRPIVFGFEVYSNIDKVSSDGLLSMPSETDQYYGGHAVAIVGYNEIKKYFIVRNSWGSTWGDKGHFYMPYEYVLSQKYADDFWVLQK